LSVFWSDLSGDWYRYISPPAVKGTSFSTASPAVARNDWVKAGGDMYRYQSPDKSDQKTLKMILSKYSYIFNPNKVHMNKAGLSLVV
jgi:hypothetical protein